MPRFRSAVNVTDGFPAALAFPFLMSAFQGTWGIHVKRFSVMFFAAISGPRSAIFFLSWPASVEFRRRLKITCRRLLQPHVFLLALFLGVASFPVIQKGTFVIYQRRSHCSPLFSF